MRRGFYPLCGVAAATEFVQLAYPGGGSFVAVFKLAVITFCAYFASLYLSRMVLDSLLPKVTEGEMSERRTSTSILMCLGLMLMIEIVQNLLPTTITLLQFLPIYVLLVYYKASEYLAVRKDCEMNFVMTGLLTVVGMPIVLRWLLGMILGA